MLVIFGLSISAGGHFHFLHPLIPSRMHEFVILRRIFSFAAWMHIPCVVHRSVVAIMDLFQVNPWLLPILRVNNGGIS